MKPEAGSRATDASDRRKSLLWRSLTILGAILAMVAIMARMVHRTEHPGRSTAQIIAIGKERHRALTDDDAGDQNLTDDEGAAGEVWADHHSGAGSGACPDYTPAFRRGCLDRMNARVTP